jgi:NTP pyrophosphatase (non-canonical NTP hydrolase)
MLIDIEKILYDLIVLAKEKENAPDWALGLKLSEECGEVAEVLLVDNGFCQHKEIKEDLFHEIADVFNVCTAILARRYTELSADEIMVRLTQAVEKKGQKYADLLNDGLNK